MKVYTRTGDTGTTALLGGKRVEKNCLEIDAIGEVDELNAAIGVVIASIGTKKTSITQLTETQLHLFNIGAHLAAVQTDIATIPEIPSGAITALEEWIDEMEAELEPLTTFILPGGHPSAAHAMLARSICRRAERHVTEVAKRYPELPTEISQYLNRLSDALFVLARWLNKNNAVKDVIWQK